ncbi:MAG: hypothetical protein Q9173_001537 [Seirophora scorigena]
MSRNLGYLFLTEFFIDSFIGIVIWANLDPANPFVSPASAPFAIGLAYGAMVWGFADIAISTNLARDLGTRFVAAIFFGRESLTYLNYSWIAILVNVPATIFATAYYEFLMRDSLSTIGKGGGGIDEAHYQYSLETSWRILWSSDGEYFMKDLEILGGDMWTLKIRDYMEWESFSVGRSTNDFVAFDKQIAEVDFALATHLACDYMHPTQRLFAVASQARGSMSSPFAIVAGVGPGTGATVARKFAASYPVALLARNPANYEDAVKDIKAAGGKAIGIPTDVTDATSMKDAVTKIQEEFGGDKCAAAVFNVGGKFIRKPFLELNQEEFESGWEANGRGAFLYSQAVLPLLLNSTDLEHPPTLIFTGATAAMKGSALTAAFSTGKFALRSLSQSLAREFGPKGVHVSHVNIDGVIDIPRTHDWMKDAGPDAKINPQAIADAYWFLHTQPRSCFTQEIDVLQGFNYGSVFTNDAPVTRQDYINRFNTARQLQGTSGFTSARLFTMIQGGTVNAPIEAIPAAIATNTQLLLGVFLSSTDEAFENEQAALRSAISQYGQDFADQVVGISVGSEDLYRISPTGIKNRSNPGEGPDAVVRRINAVRSTISGTILSEKPVGHVDTWTAYVNSSNSAVIEACDFIGTDAYPYFQTTQANSIENDESLFFDAYNATVSVAGGKPVWITETGWPVSGPTSGQAVASLDNARTYWDRVGCRVFGQINTFWFTLQDAFPTAPSPSFGIVGTTLSTTPLYDLSCPADSSSPPESSASSTSSTPSREDTSSGATGPSSAPSAGELPVAISNGETPEGPSNGETSNAPSPVQSTPSVENPSGPAGSPNTVPNVKTIVTYTTITTCPVTYTEGAETKTSTTTSAVEVTSTRGSTLATVTTFPTSGSGGAPPPPSGAKSCPADLSGAFEYPHLIVAVDKEHPDVAAGTSYNGRFSPSISSIFNFDLPTSLAGRTCSLIFLFPTRETLQTSNFTLSGSGGIEVTRLISPATEETTFNNQSPVNTTVNSIPDVRSGNSYTIGSGICSAGSRSSYKVSATGSLDLEYFQDYNPSPIGLYITVEGEVDVLTCLVAGNRSNGTGTGVRDLFVNGLNNGGSAGLVYGLLFVWLGTIAVFTTLAELASMAPTTGGQDHWISQLASPSIRTFMSYIMGWLVICGWMAILAGSGYFCGTQIEAVIQLNNPDYIPQRWHGTLLFWATVLVAVIINTTLGRLLPAIEIVMLIVHILGYFGVLIPLVAMAEEVQNASVNVPWAMLVTTLFNSAIGFGMVLAVLFVTIDITSVLESPVAALGFPYIQIFYDSVSSEGGATDMTVILLIMTVQMGSTTPVYAVVVASITACVIGLINIGSTVAFNIVISLSVASLYASYIITESFLLYRRCTGSIRSRNSLDDTTEPGVLVWGPFHLRGIFGIAVNVFAVCFGIIIFVFSFFPVSYRPGADGMNYSVVMTPAVAVFSVLYYVIWARKEFKGPIVEVTAYARPPVMAG